MKLREEICKEHSKAQCDKIVAWIGNSSEWFDELFELFITDEYRVVQRAAWPLSYAVKNHPALIKKHFGSLFKNLKKAGQPEAVKRNTVRLLQDVDIPKKYHGELMDLCFTYISSPKEKAAVKAFSLTILENLSKIYPEIKTELELVIRDRWDNETPAFKSRARGILSKSA